MEGPRHPGDDAPAAERTAAGDWDRAAEPALRALFPVEAANAAAAGRRAAVAAVVMHVAGAAIVIWY